MVKTALDPGDVPPPNRRMLDCDSRPELTSCLAVRLRRLDFLLSGRSLPAWVTGPAFISANLGAIELIGMIANGVQYGPRPMRSTPTGRPCTTDPARNVRKRRSPGQT